MKNEQAKKIIENFVRKEVRKSLKEASDFDQNKLDEILDIDRRSIYDIQTKGGLSNRSLIMKCISDLTNAIEMLKVYSK